MNSVILKKSEFKATKRLAWLPMLSDAEDISPDFSIKLHNYPQETETTIMKIFTIGHSTLSIDDFIGLLKENKIKMLVDVRSHPGSRYVPWFNMEKLKASLAESGIEYCHMSVLGGRKKSCVKEHFVLVRGWKNESFLNYASYTLTDDYDKGIDELIKKATQKQAVIMCAESVPWRCHRLLIANTLLARGVDVDHIMNSNVVKHSLNKYGAFAVVEEGKVLYPGR